MLAPGHRVGNLASLAIAACALTGLACGASARRPPVVVTGEPLPPPPLDSPERREVRPEKEPVVVAAWAEPPHLPPGGGQAQILIRLQRRGGRPAAGVEVRVETSGGRLYSSGRILTTGANGLTRDRLTTRRSARVTLNAGGTRYTILVPVLPRAASP